MTVIIAGISVLIKCTYILSDTTVLMTIV